MDFEYIEIKKELVPYRFQIALGVEVFEFFIRYNELHDYFTFDLAKEDETLILGEKITYGVPLFSEVYDERFPAPVVIPLDESGKETDVTYDNLNRTVFLMMVND